MSRQSVLRVDTSSRPRIALLANYPRDYTTFRTGVETATAALLSGLREFQDQFEFHVVSLIDAGLPDATEDHDGFRFHFLSVPGSPLVRPRLPLRVLKTYRELRSIRPSLIHCQDSMALALGACLAGNRRIFTMHGVKRHEASKRTGWEHWSAEFDALVEGYVHQHFDAFICISRYAAEVVGNEKPSFRIPNAVSPQFFQAAADQPATTHPCLVFVGVLEPLKRPSDLLSAHAELRKQFPNLETIFCGQAADKGYVDEMLARVARLGIEGVHFPGLVGRDKLASLLRNAVALVLPSGQDNAPMVIAEAMAVGIPVVATRVGGIPDMVRHGQTGYLYDVGDVEALANWLRLLLEDPPLRARLGQEARDVALRTYSSSEVAAATVSAYRHLIQQDAPAVVRGGHS